jgi:hypothetical protein
MSPRWAAKNACIVTSHGDLIAPPSASSVPRSGWADRCFGPLGAHVESDVADALLERIVEMKGARVGDPTRRENWLGPDPAAAAQFRALPHKAAPEAAHAHGRGTAGDGALAYRYP